MRTNFYPLHLEHDYEGFITSVMQKYLRSLVAEIRSSLSVRQDSIRADADSTDELIKKLSAGGGPEISAKDLEKRIARHAHLLDSWSDEQTKKLIAKSYVRYNSKQSEEVTGRPSPVDKQGNKIYELWGSQVDLSKHITDEKLTSFVRANTMLISDLGKSEKEKVTAILKNGYLKGTSNKEIIKEITHQTGIAENKARFWARDQASKFFGEVTRERQTSAGIPGYIWRTVGDPSTRDSHSALEGTYHEWKNPPKVLRANGTVVSMHPGDDFNCRCFAEPAFGEEFAEKEYEGPYAIAPPMTIAERKARAGFTPARWKNTGDFRERVAVGIPESVVKREVEGALDDVAKVLNIPPRGYQGKAFSVSMISQNNPPYGENIRGLFSPRSGHIFLSPTNRYHRSTTVHELFHGLFPAIQIGAPQEYEKLMDAVRKTKRYKAVIRFNSYYKSETEMFSRLMEFYISDRSGSGIYEFMNKARNNNFYWVDEEAKELYYLIDRIFRKLGWAK